MKGNKKPHPYYSRRVVRREIARRLKAESENAQLRAQMQSLHEQLSRIEGATKKAVVYSLGALYGGKSVQ